MWFRVHEDTRQQHQSHPSPPLEMAVSSFEAQHHSAAEPQVSHAMCGRIPAHHQQVIRCGTTLCVAEPPPLPQQLHLLNHMLGLEGVAKRVHRVRPTLELEERQERQRHERYFVLLEDSITRILDATKQYNVAPPSCFWFVCFVCFVCFDRDSRAP